MVDPTQGVGSKLPTVASAEKPEQLKSLRKKDEVEKSEKKDEVVLSDKALSQLEAERVAKEAREQLEKSEFSLGLNPNFNEKI
jgi:hypothetical protein